MSAVQRSAPVAVGVDGTERSAGAVRYAIEEARTRGTSLQVVHVMPATQPVGGAMPYVPYPMEEVALAGREVLRAAVAQANALAPDLEIEGVLRRGLRVVELADAAESSSLMVLGRETRHGVERVFTGATTGGVGARVPVPVAVVPATWEPTDRGRVVVGTKSCANLGELMSYAFPLAAARHAALRVVHAWQVPDPYLDLTRARTRFADRMRSSSRLLEVAVAEWRESFPDVDVEVSVVYGQPARSLIDAAGDADLLVVARHPRDLEHLVRLGPTARAVIGLSDTPVEVVPLTGTPTYAPLVLERSGAIVKN